VDIDVGDRVAAVLNVDAVVVEVTAERVKGDLGVFGRVDAHSRVGEVVVTGAVAVVHQDVVRDHCLTRGAGGHVGAVLEAHALA